MGDDMSCPEVKIKGGTIVGYVAEAPAEPTEDKPEKEVPKKRTKKVTTEE